MESTGNYPITIIAIAIAVQHSNNCFFFNSAGQLRKGGRGGGEEGLHDTVKNKFINMKKTGLSYF